MPAFSEQAGGHLTDEQIELIVNGMRSTLVQALRLPKVSNFLYYSVDETAIASGPPTAIQQRYLGEGSPGWRRFAGRCNLQNLLFELSRIQMAMVDRQARSLIQTF